MGGGSILQGFAGLVNPFFLPAQMIGGDTAAAVVDPVLYMATNSERQANRQAEEDARQKAIKAATASSTSSPDPFTTYYKQPW